jgi:hypothetical protein
MDTQIETKMVTDEVPVVTETELKVNYKHFYCPNVEYKDMNRKTKFGKAVITAAYVIDRGYVRVGFSFCSPENQFSRPDGRDRAFDRMNLSPVIVEHLDYITVETIMLNLSPISCSVLPHWYSSFRREYLFKVWNRFTCNLDNFVTDMIDSLPSPSLEYEDGLLGVLSLITRNSICFEELFEDLSTKKYPWEMSKLI